MRLQPNDISIVVYFLVIAAAFTLVVRVRDIAKAYNGSYKMMLRVGYYAMVTLFSIIIFLVIKLLKDGK